MFHLLFVTNGLDILSLAKQTFCFVCIFLKYVGAICQAHLISTMSNGYKCYFHNLYYSNQKPNMIKTINTDFKIKQVKKCSIHLVMAYYNFYKVYLQDCHETFSNNQHSCHQTSRLLQKIYHAKILRIFEAKNLTFMSL